MAEATHEIHGIKFIRTGSCNQCEGCEHECSVCPHGELKEGKWHCKLYDPDTRGKVCDFCTNNKSSPWYNNGKDVTHQICIDFPDHPFLYVIHKGKCGYKFTPINKTEEDKVSQLNIKYAD